MSMFPLKRVWPFFLPWTHLVIIWQLRPADEHRFALMSSKSRKNLQQRREGVKQILRFAKSSSGFVHEERTAFGSHC